MLYILRAADAFPMSYIFSRWKGSSRKHSLTVQRALSFRDDAMHCLEDIHERLFHLDSPVMNTDTLRCEVRASTW